MRDLKTFLEVSILQNEVFTFKFWKFLSMNMRPLFQIFENWSCLAKEFSAIGFCLKLPFPGNVWPICLLFSGEIEIEQENETRGKILCLPTTVPMM